MTADGRENRGDGPVDEDVCPVKREGDAVGARAGVVGTVDDVDEVIRGGQFGLETVRDHQVDLVEEGLPLRPRGAPRVRSPHLSVVVLDDRTHLVRVRRKLIRGARAQAREPAPRARQLGLNAGDRVVSATLSPRNVRLGKLQPPLIGGLRPAVRAGAHGVGQKIVDIGD